MLINSMVHTDLMHYSESTADMFAAKFNEMLKKKGIDVNAFKWKWDPESEDPLTYTFRDLVPLNYHSMNQITRREVEMLFTPDTSPTNSQLCEASTSASSNKPIDQPPPPPPPPQQQPADNDQLKRTDSEIIQLVHNENMNRMPPIGKNISHFLVSISDSNQF